MGATTTKEQPKTCTGCGKEKPAGAFYVASGMRDGRMSKCRDCMVEAQRIYRNREKSGQSSLLRQPPKCSKGELEEETFEARRDNHILLVHAASKRWCTAEDKEDRDGAKDALIFRCRQLLEAEGLVST